MNTSEATVAIKEYAIQLGFTHVGISKATGLEEEKKHLEQWIEKKYHATMEYMSRDIKQRTDPGKILAAVESVISLGINYYAPMKHTQDKNFGKISRYAWGDDYHEIMSGKMDELVSFIKKAYPDSSNKTFVDSGPAMDKAWAVRSGIGWLGKHTNVITRDMGSWIFLGEIFTSVQLESDVSIEDYCGTCTKCIDACPTDAIVEPYVLDSNKCISFHTIESKTETIPNDIGKYFDNWIFGCDICQDVCPWNSFAKETQEKKFYPYEYNIAPSISELFQLNQEEFLSKYKRSSIKRAKWKGMQRNLRNVLNVYASNDE